MFALWRINRSACRGRDLQRLHNRAPRQGDTREVGIFPRPHTARLQTWPVHRLTYSHAPWQRQGVVRHPFQFDGSQSMIGRELKELIARGFEHLRGLGENIALALPPENFQRLEK